MEKSKTYKTFFGICLSISMLFTSCEQLSNSSEINNEKNNNDESVIKDKTSPGEIENLICTEGNSFVSFLWTNPNDSDFVSTQITFSPDVEKITQPIIILGEAGGSSNKLIEGLSNGIEYTFTFKTIDDNNNISQGFVKKASPKLEEDFNPPGEIENLICTEGNSSLLFSWRNPDDSDFIYTQITFIPEVETIIQPIIIQGGRGENSSKLIEGLTNETEYTFIFQTVDSNSNKSQGIVKTDTPKLPTDVIPPSEIIGFESVSRHTRIELSWTNPNDTDFVAVEISANPPDGILSQPIIIQTEPSIHKTYTVTGLENGKEYNFTIQTLDSNNNKSEGVVLQATPIESILSLNVTLPNDSENIILTNDEAPINVSILSSHPIKKAVWKNVDKNDTSTAEDIINDNTSEEFVITTNSIIYVKENGFYNIAVQNEEDVCKHERVEVRTIDKTPPSEVSNLNISIDRQKNIKTSWDNAITDNEYDSHLEKIRISYIFNNNDSDLDNLIIEKSPAEYNYSFAIPIGKDENDFVEIKIQTIDTLGNVSKGLSKKKYCCTYIKGTIDEIIEEIVNMKSSGKISIVGEVDFSSIRNALNQLKNNNSSIRVDLDLTNIDGIAELPKYSLNGCTNLRSIIIPDGVIGIGEDAFRNCENLTTISIPVSLSAVSEKAFYGCNSFSRINYKGSLSQWMDKELDPGKFPEYDLYINNEKIIDVTVPENVGVIKRTSFTKCKSLESVTFYNTTDIENNTFMNIRVNYLGGSLSDWCNGKYARAFSNYYLYINGQEQTDIQIPNDVISIKEWSFNGCKSLTSVIISGNTKTIEQYAFNSCVNLNSISIADGVENLETSSFSYTNLATLTIPGSVKVIGSMAFYYCANLTTLIISEGVTEIGSSAFVFCKKLTDVSLPEGLKTLNGNAFLCCESLANITIPSSVNYIGSGVFLGCYSTAGVPNLNIDFVDKTHYWRCGQTFEDSGETSISWSKLAKCLIDSKWANINSSWKRE